MDWDSGILISSSLKWLPPASDQHNERPPMDQNDTLSPDNDDEQSFVNPDAQLSSDEDNAQSSSDHDGARRRMEGDNSIDISSSFRKFPYRTSILELEAEGYRLATVYETEKLLLKANIIQPHPDQLLPLQGSDEAFRLKDGYLFDFGPLWTFYPNQPRQFQLTHKLGIKADIITNAPELCLPLALLHACQQPDYDEIEQIVENAGKDGNSIELVQTSLIKARTLMKTEEEINHQDAHILEGGELRKQLVCSGALKDNGDRKEKKRKRKGCLGGTDHRPSAVSLLECRTPWIDGGTVLHYAARTAHDNPDLCSRLLDLAAKIGCDQELFFCENYDGNIALSAGMISCNKLLDNLQIEKYYIEGSLLSATNPLGDNVIKIACKKGILHAFTLLGSKISVETAGKLLCYLLSSQPLDDEVLQLGHPISTIANFLGFDDNLQAKWIFGSRNNLGLSAFDIALNTGRSWFCKDALSKYLSPPTYYGVDVARPSRVPDETVKPLFQPECDLSRLMLDGDGNNILHRYAIGGANREVGQLILNWLEVGKNLELHSATPTYERQFKQSATVEVLIKELNVHGEPPCISALLRGHYDAFEVLMPRWGQELAHRYLHPVTSENVVHCYARSSYNDWPAGSNWLADQLCPDDKIHLQELMDHENEHHYTPLHLALHSGNVNALWWLLESDKNAPEKLRIVHRSLHWFCIIFDDDEAAELLLQTMASNEDLTGKNWINWRQRVWDEPRLQDAPGWDQYKNYTALELAILSGNARTCEGLLNYAEKWESTYPLYVEFKQQDEIGDNGLLHLLCSSKWWKPDYDPEKLWQKLLKASEEHADINYMAELLGARNEDGETPLLVSLGRGKNIRACRWLLESHFDAVKNSMVGAGEVFRCFAEGGCSDQFIWEKLKQAFLTQENANTIWRTSIHAALQSDCEGCAMLFLQDPDVLASIPEDPPKKLSSNVVSSWKILAQLRRDGNCKSIFCNNVSILQQAAEGGWFQLFDLMIQAQSAQDLHRIFYEQLLPYIMRCKSVSMINCMLQLVSMRFAKHNYSPVTIFSKQRFWQSTSRMEVLPPAWLWASLHLLEAVPAISDKEGGAHVYEQHHNLAGTSREEADTAHWLQLEKSFFEEALSELSGGWGKFDHYSRECSLALLQLLSKRISALVDLQGGEGQMHILMTDLLAKNLREDVPEVVSFMLDQLPSAPSQKLQYTQTFAHLLREYVARDFHQSVHAVLYHVIRKSTGIKAMKELLTCPIADDSRKTSIKHKRTIVHAAAAYTSKEFDSHIGALRCFILLMTYLSHFRLESIRDHEGNTALHICLIQPSGEAGGLTALNRSKTAFVIMSMQPELAKYGRRSGRTPLHDSAYNGDEEIVSQLLKLKEEPNALLEERDADGRTALHFAAASESPEARRIAKRLVAHAREKGDYAALLLWASAGHLIGMACDVARRNDVIEYLEEEMGAERRRLYKSKGLLQRAMDRGSSTMIRELINRGADMSKLPPDYMKKLELYHTRESDQPSTKDYLGRFSLVKGIAALLLNPFTATPITIGVLGPWGTGKSSIMTQIEITIWMTIIGRNVLARYQVENEFSRIMDGEVKSKSKKTLHHSIMEASTRLKNKSEVPTSNATMKSLVNTCFSLAFNKISQTFWPKEDEKGYDTKWEDNFLGNYIPECKNLYKGLALMDKEQSLLDPNSIGSTHSIPPCITIYYNAWLYHGENEALSGLAFCILKELEDSMDTSQWLKLCWEYANKSNPMYIQTNIILPILVFISMGGWILWILWKVLSLPSINGNEALKHLKYGSLPVSMLIGSWFLFNKIINIVKPISEQIAQYFGNTNLYADRLGYQQKIINDINFFKKSLGERVEFWWRILSIFWSIIVENKNYIPSTNIKKAKLLRNNLRIIVFVDDLDRCNKSSYVLELLGDINLVLSACNINVVLGMDKEMVKEILKKEYGEDEKNDIVIDKFLEKIIQLPTDLYETSEQDFSSFLQEQLVGQPKEDSESICVEGGGIVSGSNKKESNAITHENNEIVENPSTPSEESIALVLEGASGPDINLIMPTPQVVEQQLYNLQSNESVHSNIETLETEARTMPIISSSGNYTLPPTMSNNSFSRHAGERYVIEFPMLVANYNESEVRAFKYLQTLVSGHKRQPRGWKRLLNYHRLVWYIISQSKSQLVREHYGWQEQLIVWVFICFNWQEQMNQIFKNWDTLVRLKGVDIKTSTIHEIINNHMESNNLQGDDEWKSLETALFGSYDIDLLLVIAFQDFRFHCDARRLTWENISAPLE